MLACDWQVKEHREGSPHHTWANHHDDGALRGHDRWAAGMKHTLMGVEVESLSRSDEGPCGHSLTRDTRLVSEWPQWL